MEQYITWLHFVMYSAGNVMFQFLDLLFSVIGITVYVTGYIMFQVLRGHMASVVQVQFHKARGQLLSFSKDKILRIWDVQLQVCIQRLAGMFPKGPEGSVYMWERCTIHYGAVL